MDEQAKLSDALAEQVDLYASTVPSLDIDVSTIGYNTKGTIIFHQGAQPDHLLFPIERLPRLSIEQEEHQDSATSLEQAAPMAEFALKEKIGEGGMGLILRGVQLPMQREIAIKRLRPDVNQPAAQMALLREAWITGALQHPNIVPVYALGCLPDASPCFVMKRIAGVGWDKLMHQPAHPLRAKSEKDHLTWNLEILMQVCNAVHFAHAKGILHRDLKPENVMLGDFGEVYVLDWGIAVSTRNDDALPLPRASECDKIMGTPAYMAPEMATCQAAQISERTDVYLLGAILHEILTNQPKHLGETLMEVLFSAATSLPHEYPVGIPAALAAICQKATHRQPEQRYEDADALRKALAHFLLCRNSIDLSAQAHELLVEIQGLSDTSQTSPASPGGTAPSGGHIGLLGPDAYARIYGMFHEASYGFRQALRIWQDNEEARAGIELLHLAMAAYEIHQRDPKAALLHLASVAAPPEAMRQEIAALEQLELTKDEQAKRFQQFELDSDITQGRRTRSFMSLIMGLLFLPYFLMFGRTLQWFRYTHLCHIGTCAGFSVIVLGLGWWARETMSSTALNRKIMQGLAVLSMLLWAQAISAWVLDKPPTQALVQLSLLSSLFLGMWGTFVDDRMYWPALVYLLMYLLSSVWPPLLFEIAGVGNLLALWLVAMFWRPEKLIRSPEERRLWREEQQKARQERKSKA